MKESEITNENDIINQSEEIVENKINEKQLENKESEINIKIEEKEEKKEKQNKIKKQTHTCQLCSKNYKHDSNIKCILFNNCEHEICYFCLYKLLIRSYIKPISQIHQTNNKKTENFSPQEKTCEKHNSLISKFCLECFEPLCEKCFEEHNKIINISKNKEHKSTSYNDFFMKLYKNLEEIPNLKIIFGTKRNFEENFYEKYCDLINIKFENLVNELNYIKEKILDKIKLEYEQYKQGMEAIYLLYKYYNYELSSINNETDINQLLFLYNTNISIPELKYQFSKAEIILNDTIKKLNETKLENMFIILILLVFLIYIIINLSLGILKEI